MRILLPKVETPRDILDANDLLDEEEAPVRALKLWAMIETPSGAAQPRRDCRARPRPGARGSPAWSPAPTTSSRKPACSPRPTAATWSVWLMHMVLAARAGGLVDVLDGVMPMISAIWALFERECEEGRRWAFDGKTLIHPDQIAPVQCRAFSPVGGGRCARPRAIVAAFAAPENAGKGVIDRRRKDDRAAPPRPGGETVACQGCRAPARTDRRRTHETLPLPDRPGRFELLPQGDGGAEQGLAPSRRSPTYAFDAETKTMRCGQAVVKDVDGKSTTSPAIKLSDY
jgi:hypothetical protein